MTSTSSAESGRPASFSLLKEDANELYENAPCAYLSTLPDGTLIKVNATFLEWTGYQRDALLNRKRFQELLPVAGRIFYDTHFGPLMLMQGFVKELAFDIIGEDGTRIPVLLNSALKRDEAGNPLVIRTTLIDARGRRSYEEELRLAKRKAEEAEAITRKLAQDLEQLVAQRTQERDRIWRLSQDILAVGSLEGRFISTNPAFTTTLGWTGQEVETLSLAGLVAPEHRPRLDTALERLAAGNAMNRLDFPLRHKDGSFRWISWTVAAEGEELYMVGHDVTEALKQTEALHKAEEALRQAQKMEAIGNLTGGVAHDFNNILQVIAGSVELLKLEFSDNEKATARLQGFDNAVERGAKLASQLLAFARRQPLQPMPTNLGRVLQEMDDLLRRALGDTVEVETVVDSELWTVLVDRHQMENAILNLAINARDAMEGEGKLTLELSNAILDDAYADSHVDVSAGQYVMLAISDTGPGMPPDVMERAFEPFFTTKPEGKGTGLGLSMVYGFVKQSGGHVKIYSEQGNGTTFRIYLPCTHQSEAAFRNLKERPVVGGTETILVAEDDPDVQNTAVEILRSLGYQVLKANDGQSALSILQSGVHVDLLFTDVVMPGPIRSPDLAKHAQRLLPNIKILFTSGYTHNAIVHGGRLDSGVELISKPYRREELARKVRHILGTP